MTPRPTHFDQRRLHLARSGRTVIGLERRHHPNQGAFHRLAPDLAAWVDWSALAFRRARPAPHPFACRNPIQPRQWHGGRFRLPRPGRLALRRPASGTEKMRLPDVCNRLTTRAPFGLVDSCARPPSALRLSSCATQVELRLTATLQLRPSPPIALHPLRRPEPRRTWDETPLGPGGCCDRQPLRRCPPAAALSTAARVGSVASDALCRAR